MKKLLFLAGAGLAAYFIFRKTQAVNNLKYQLINIQPQITAGGARVTLSVQVSNPSLEEFVIDAIGGGVSFGDFFLGTASTTAQVKIPAGGTVVVPIDLNVTVGDGVRLLTEYLTTPGIVKPQFSFNGNVQIKGVILPLNLVYKIPSL
jgi:hypothetical protein